MEGISFRGDKNCLEPTILFLIRGKQYDTHEGRREEGKHGLLVSDIDISVSVNISYSVCQLQWTWTADAPFLQCLQTSKVLFSYVSEESLENTQAAMFEGLFQLIPYCPKKIRQ